MENATCIICGNTKFSPYLDVKCRFTNEDFKLSQCICSLVLTSPRPTSNNISAYYNNDNYFPHSNLSSNQSFFHKVLKKISCKWKFRLIKKYIYKDQVDLLDIGGGDGSFAIYLNNENCKVNVYEKDESCVKFINNNNVFATNDLKKLTDSKYNFITLWHSLEHVHDIEELFEHINRISKNDCLMLIAVPNILAAEIDCLSYRWIAWDAPRHLYHFSYDTLDLLLEKYNWEIIKTKNMNQDTLFNIYMSLKTKSLLNMMYCIYIYIYSTISQILFKKKRSTNLVICKKK